MGVKVQQTTARKHCYRQFCGAIENWCTLCVFLYPANQTVEQNDELIFWLISAFLVIFSQSSTAQHSTCNSFSLSRSSSSPSPAPAAAAAKPAPAFREYDPCPRPALELPSVCARSAEPRSSLICAKSRRQG